MRFQAFGYVVEVMPVGQCTPSRYPMTAAQVITALENDIEDLEAQNNRLIHKIYDRKSQVGKITHQRSSDRFENLEITVGVR